MPRRLNILMPLSDGYGGFGGIAEFNRNFLEALDDSPLVQEVRVLPRLILGPIAQQLPARIIHDQRAANSKLAFAWRMLCQIWASKPDLVISGHINLLPLAYLVAKLRRSRLAVILHGIDAWTPRERTLVNFLIRKVDSVVAVSPYTVKRFLEWSQVPSERVSIIYNTVDLARFRPSTPSSELVARYGFSGCRILLTVGRTASDERYKGFDEVIDVMPPLLQRHPTLRYLIVGDGTDRSRLEQKVEQLGLTGKVVFAGRISEDEKVAHYNIADVYVMPSYGEGFGIVFLEAAACGVPVIGSTADGSQDALLQGRLGRLVDPRKPSELIDAIQAALTQAASPIHSAALELFDKQHYRAAVARWIERQQVQRRAGSR